LKRKCSYASLSLLILLKKIFAVTVTCAWLKKTLAGNNMLILSEWLTVYRIAYVNSTTPGCSIIAVTKLHAPRPRDFTPPPSAVGLQRC
jgi:hypothetical protein